EIFRKAIEDAVKRLTPGFLRTVALSTPLPPNLDPSVAAFQPGPRYSQLRERLGKSVSIIEAELSTGQVPESADVLLVMAPVKFEEKERFAIDQFLMRGGAVVLTTSNYRINMKKTFSVSEEKSGLEDWLSSYGVKINPEMVLDRKNNALPIPVERTVSDYVIREIIMVPYPYFPDIRTEGLSQENPVTASLGQLTMNWASPLIIDYKKEKNLTIEPLVWSSSQSWVSPDKKVEPDYELFPEVGFSVRQPLKSEIFSVAITGRFISAFSGKSSPLLSKIEKTTVDEKKKAPIGLENEKINTSQQAINETTEEPPIEASGENRFRGVITHSPDNTKLIVVSSSNFASDIMLNLASQGTGTTYTRPIDFLQNVIDWATEDPSLLTLRGKTQFANTLRPISAKMQTLLEYMNYAFAAIGLLLVLAWRRIVLLRDRKHYGRILKEVAK
ncbi:MAG: Gldg family protein, partial [Alphaproteobacteria bacterium]|nr:Gldg family protein [Alphaproteobacteria bacterium]